MAPESTKPLASLPWLNVDCPSAVTVTMDGKRITVKPAVFAVAVDGQKIVGGAPLGMHLARFVDYDVRKFWELFRLAKAKMWRSDPK